MLKRLTLILLALATVLTLSLVGPGVARAAQLLPDQVDADGNGSTDAVVRESPYNANWTYGARCDISANTKTITIRPPAIGPLWSLGSEWVAWRPAIYNATTNQTIYGTTAGGYGAWTSATALAGYWVAPGSGYDLSNYWSGSQTISVGATWGTWYPLLQVAWQNPNTQTWTTRNLQARWVEVKISGTDGFFSYHDYAC